jgi:putative PIN family toxin of toxin-antitoxin system
MRVVLGTNVLLSALISPHGTADQLYQAWRTGRFTLLTSEAQLEEFRRVSRDERIRPILDSAAAGTVVNELRELAVLLNELPKIAVSADPFDNFLFAMARAGQADYLVSGDRAGVLTLGTFEATRIITVRHMLRELGIERKT